MISVFPAWFIFRYLKYPKNCALMKEDIVISEPPSTYTHFKSLNFMLLGKEVVEKMILVLEKSLIFSQKFCMNHALYFTDISRDILANKQETLNKT